MSNDNLGESTLNLIASEDFTNVLAQLTKNVLSKELLDGTTREIIDLIPAVKVFKGILETYRNAQDYLLRKKLLLFLESLENLSEEGRSNLISNIKNDENFRQTIGDNLILVIDMLDDIQKPKILGNFFKAYLENEITYIVFRKLEKALRQISISSIHTLELFYSTDNIIDDKKISNMNYFDSYAMQELISTGVVTSHRSFLAPKGTKAGCTDNELGRLFLKYMDS